MYVIYISYIYITYTYRYVYLQCILAIGHHPSPTTLQAWAATHTEDLLPPNDLDTMFSAGFEVYEQNHFACVNMVLTTRRILRFPPAQGPYVEMICNDDTCGTNWHGFAVMLSGISDAGRHFHNILLSICTKKDSRSYNFIAHTLMRLRPDLVFRFSMSDAAQAIFNGFSEVYAHQFQLMCYMHVFIKNMLKVNCSRTPLCKMCTFRLF